MPPLSDSNKVIDNPWFPEGGPGRHLKARLKRSDVLIGATLEAYADSLLQEPAFRDTRTVTMSMSWYFWCRTDDA